MKRGIVALALLVSSASLGACDPIFHVGALVPVAAPVDTRCISAVVTNDTGSIVAVRADSEAGGRNVVTSHVGRMSDHRYRWVRQVVEQDTGIHHDTVYQVASAHLHSDYNRLGMGTTAEVDTVASQLTALLFEVRARCVDKSSVSEAVYRAEANDPPYESWTLRGTNGRTLMRLRGEDLHHFGIFLTRIGRYALYVDTLSSDSDLRHPHWLPSGYMEVAPPPKHTKVASHCARGVGEPDGDLIALVRDADRPLLSHVRKVWSFDRRTGRFLESDTAGVLCENSDWYTVLPLAPPALRASALTFRPPPGFARVYVFLDGFSYSGEGLPPIDIDGRTVGRLEPGSFLMVDLEPGREYSIQSSAEHGRAVRVNPAADSTYFVQIAWRKWAWKRNADAKLVAAERGRSQIRSARMVSSTWPQNRGAR